MTMEEMTFWTLIIALLALIVGIIEPFLVMFIQERRDEKKKSRTEQAAYQQNWHQIIKGKAWLLFTSKVFTINIGTADRIRLTVNGTSGIELLYSVYNNGATPILQREHGKRYRRKWSPIIEIMDNNTKCLTFMCTTRFFFILARIHYTVEYVPSYSHFSGSMGDMFSIKPAVPTAQPSIVGWPHNLK